IVGAVIVITVIVVSISVFTVSSVGATHRQSRQGLPAVTGDSRIADPDQRKEALDAGVNAATLMAQLLPLDATAARVLLDNTASDAYRPALRSAVDGELV